MIAYKYGFVKQKNEKMEKMKEFVVVSHYPTPVRADRHSNARIASITP